MASSSLEDDVIVITITNSDQSGRQSSVAEETLVPDEEIPAWKFPSFPCYPKRLKIRAYRSRLVERSSYFRGMLNWSFRESGLDRVSIDWDVEAFVDILKCIHGCSIDIDSENFVSLYEGSLYFGVGVLLEKCKAWFAEAAMSTGSPQIQLDELICVWEFGFKHAKDFLPDLCVTYLAKNFNWAISFKCFINIPYKLLESCLQHQHLTVESEMHMCDALFIWLDANTKDSEDLSGAENNCIEILKQIRPSLLPLDFTSGKRRSRFSKLVNESIAWVFRILNNPPTTSTSFLDSHDSNDFRIRVTKFSTKMNLSSCTQITTEMVILSLLPHRTDSTLKRDCKELLIKLRSLDRNLFSDSLGNRPMLSFESLEEVNISKCRGLDLQALIMCFSVSFPSLRRLKAAHLLNFNMKTLNLLVCKCLVIQEVDLSLDMSPVISEQNSSNSVTFGGRPSIWKPMMSNITKLILQGRSELSDLDLLHISKCCSNIQYLNIRGCTALSDQGISTVIRREVRLESILACRTSFGLLSVLELCSTSQPSSGTSDELSECTAFNLKTLHIGSCKCLDEADLMKLISKARMLKSLCLRDTRLTDQAVHSFSGSSLVMLDITNTMVSGTTIARVVSGNPDLKCLRVKGCKNLCQLKSNNEMTEGYNPLDYCGEQESALGKTSKLVELSIGWGFFHLSMEVLKPAITSLREITVGLGGSLGEAALIQLPASCPNLEFIVLGFQVISDAIIINIMERLRNLRVLALSYCFGDISISSFKLYVMPCLSKLELKRVIPWMSNNDLFVLTKNCPNLTELSLLGCPNLDPDSQQIISQGWPGLVSLYLEECGEVTANGVSSLFDCVSLEDLLLRHNGPGIQSSFILDASFKLPLLRLVSLDLCDSCQGYFDMPSSDHACSLRSVKMAKCYLKECGLALQCVEPRKRPVHKETLVFESSGIPKVVKERL